MSNETPPDEYPAPGYAWYVVAVLTIAYIFSFIDRQIINLMVEPIKRDLEINDLQISYLMGLSFAMFYTLFGIPLGRLADTRSRRMIISLGIAFWSLMTAGCGITKRYWDLALMRMGVGVGEAALSPAAYSLIADYFPPNRRSTAMSVYSMGIYIGSGLAFILGGAIIKYASGQESFVVPVLGSVRNWQVVFFIVGLPGLLVALLLLTVKEPIRRASAEGGTKVRIATLGETFSYVLQNKMTFTCLCLGVALATLSSYASIGWIPTMFARKFKWNPATIGMVYGTIIATAGTLGVVSGGWLADRWSESGTKDAPLRVAWIGCLGGIPCCFAYPIMSSGELTAYILVLTVFFTSMPFGVAPAAIQRMMPNTMRAQATAIYLFVINLIGMGLGPTVVALLTTNYFEDVNAVHRSLQIVGVGSYVVASILLGVCLSNYRASLNYLQDWADRMARQPAE